MATIVEFITWKYKIENKVSLNMKVMQGLQNEYLIAKIKKKHIHSVLFSCLEDMNVDFSESSAWLTYENISARSKESLCWLQDRNVFFGAEKNKMQTLHLCEKKYDLLASELAVIHNAKVNIVPIVITWDAIVTKYHKQAIITLIKRKRKMTMNWNLLKDVLFGKI